MWMLASAAKGKTAVFTKDTYGCSGGGVGLGFGNQYLAFPGGIECFYYFLSTGNAQWERRKEVAKQIENFVTKDFLEDFLHGEGYLQSPELVKEFVQSMPIMEIPSKYVAFKPLAEVERKKKRDLKQRFAAALFVPFGETDRSHIFGKQDSVEAGSSKS